MGETQLNRLDFETIEHDFIVEQLNAYLAADVDMFHPMPPSRMALRVGGAKTTDTGVKIQFVDDNIPDKTIDRPDPVEIYVLRP